MTTPQYARRLKLNHFDSTRVYDVDGREYPSVTSIIGMQDKPALVPWAAKMAAEYAADNLEILNHLDRHDAILLIKTNWRKQRDRAADFGTDVHRYIDEGKLPAEGTRARGYVLSADQFLNDHNLLVLHSELSVVNEAAGYAGTVDLVCADKDTGVVALVDWKTGGLYFDSAGMQLVALMTADSYIDEAGELAEVPYQIPEYGYAVGLREDGYQMKGIDRDTDAAFNLYQAFNGLIDVWKLKRHQHDWSIG